MSEKEKSFWCDSCEERWDVGFICERCSGEELISVYDDELGEEVDEIKEHQVCMNCCLCCAMINQQKEKP